MSEAPPLSDTQRAGLEEALEGLYTIQGLVGAGGMGVVFRARDVKHERDVAIKILRPELAASLGAERFLREIRIEAGLNHPHILPVYDSGEAAGLLYCVTPFVEGETLADRIRRERQLPTPAALQICREIADALAFAHAHGIMHRDVKPGNILLESGHAVLADFGLAKAVSAADEQSLTRTGFAVGTPAYSSPEQAAGDAPDHRADLYSLGCVLYEMLAGQAPFQGPTSDSVVRQHMTAPPTSVQILRPAVPDEVEDILDSLLAKSPADRFTTAEELVTSLDAAISGEFVRRPSGQRRTRSRRRWRFAVPAAAAAAVVLLAGVWARRVMSEAADGATAGFDARDIAVLYFDDLSPDGSLAYVADGLTEGLMKSLSRVGGLQVVSPNGVAPFRGAAAALDTVAEALEAGTLIRGGVEPVGEDLRVSIHLVEGLSGTDFARRTFVVPADAYLQAQDSLVEEASRLLRERLGEEVRLRRQQSGTSVVDAWALVQRGERERKLAETQVATAGPEVYLGTLARADSFFALAEAADPEWVTPPASRGWVAYRTSRLTPDLQERLAAIDRGMDHAGRALELDPAAASALELRGTLRYWHWILGVTPDADEAEALLMGAKTDLEDAVAVEPALASAHSTLSHLYYQVADLTGALMSARAAYEADAFLTAAPEVLWRLFTASYDTERLTQARSACDEGYRRFTQDFRFRECKLMELSLPAVAPDVPEAWRFQAEAVALAPEAYQAFEEHKTAIYVAAVLASAQEADSARSVLLRARAGANVDPARELPFYEARVRVLLGDEEEAVSLLRSLFAGFESGEEGGAEWAAHWWWNDLRGNPDFERLVEASR